MKRLMLKQLILGACVMASTVWADAITANPSIWTYDPLTYVPVSWKTNTAKNFHGSVEVGDKQEDGATSLQDASGALTLSYEPGIYEIEERVNYDRETSSGTVSKDQLKTYTGFDYYFGYRIWGFVLNDYERNPPQFMDYKTRTGGGIKFDILRNPFWKLNVGVADLYRAQRSTTGTNYTDNLLSYRLLFKVKSDSTTYSLVGFYLPSLSNGSYEWTVDTSLTFDVTAVLAFKIGWSYDYNSVPLDASVPKWDRQYYTRVVLKF